jgi:signal transduction histidine kinase
VNTFRPQAVAKGLALDADIEAGSDDALLGDPTRVRQILFNLLSNALKFTERGGTQYVSLGRGLLVPAAPEGHLWVHEPKADISAQFHRLTHSP